MSFIDNQKIVGTAFFFIGILMIIAALLQLVDGFTMEGGLGEQVGYIIAAIGAIIAAVMYFKFGNKVRTNAITGKLNILGNYILVVGGATVVSAIFAAIGGIISDISFWGSVISFILGLIVVWAGKKVLDGKETTIDKILWIILTVLFVLLFISSFINIFGGDIITILVSICSAIVYLFMLCYMFDGEVKKGMGM